MSGALGMMGATSVAGLVIAWVLWVIVSLLDLALRAGPERRAKARRPEPAPVVELDPDKPAGRQRGRSNGARGKAARQRRRGRARNKARRAKDGR